ncbi:serine aminopeptidase domain-containing protein [Tropicimonas sp. S265A]|uniref:serine aminopeptidase domain-containing protein n=1 Tax=Tropicimonas sp. S265A TaxID=3415134 RepID=UPI003C799D4E
MTFIRAAVLLVGLCAACLSIWKLEGFRAGLDITHVHVGTTPVTVYADPAAPPGPAVVIAHGFAGSRQLMEAFALTLARAGYVAVSFDFEGHGRNPTPMSGDVTAIDGTTQLLMSETGRVTDYALGLGRVDGRVALLGHSMASDVIVRQTIADPSVEATVAISLFSQAVTAQEPGNLIAINGEWEATLREEARRIVQLIDPQAAEGQTVRGDGILRRAVFAPRVEHVGVLYAPTSLREARDWLDQTFERTSSSPLATTGGWIALLLASLVALSWPVMRLLPSGPPLDDVPRTTFWMALGSASLVTPLLLAPFDVQFLPVLVADYLGVHLLVFGVIVLGILWWRDVRFDLRGWIATLALVAFGLGVFGVAMDRYVASFMPHLGRLPIIAALGLGAVAYMVSDAALTGAGHARLWRRLAAKAGFLASLGLAVVLDFEGLFFLLIILPVILLYFLVFGAMGGWAGRRTGAVFGVGLALGLILAWSLGVSFPMFDAS